MPKKDEEQTLFAQRLRLMRRERGWTQMQIADLLGIKRSTYAYYETCTSEPDMDTLVRLAALFHTSVDFLVGNADSVAAPRMMVFSSKDPDKALILTEDEEQMLSFFRALGERDQKNLLKIAVDKLGAVYNQFPNEDEQKKG